jgi:hypothetical protein
MRCFNVVLSIIAISATLAWGSCVAAFELAPLTRKGPDESTFTLSASNRVRGEFADWFEAGPPNDNSNYDFLGNRTQVGIAGKWRWLSGFLQYQHTILEGIPEHGVGVGGTYRQNTHSTFQEQGWLRQGWLQGEATGAGWRFSLLGGRFRYLDGQEALSKNPSLEWIRKNRISERLIGPFDYTHIGRSFDGARVAIDGTALNLTGFYLVPTSGGFEISAGRHMGIDLGGLSLMMKDHEQLPGAEGRLFWIHYHDGRPGDRDVVVLDNRPLAARQADHGDITVETIGADLVYAHEIGPGVADGLAWAAGQVGDWQSLDQRSWAYAVEAGYRLPNLTAKPWLRVGLFRSSGDDDPTDGDHGTFFQMLPTSRLYAFTPFYNLMNNQDVMVQLLTRPLAALATRLDFHWLRVTEGRDLLYFGGGATKRDSFGFGGTPAGGSHETAYVVEATVTYTVTRNLELQGYCGHAFGQGVVRQGFPHDQDLTYGFVEGTVSF